MDAYAYEIKPYNDLSIARGIVQIDYYSDVSNWAAALGTGMDAYDPGFDESGIFEGQQAIAVPSKIATFYFYPGQNGLVLYTYTMNPGFQTISQAAQAAVRAASPDAISFEGAEAPVEFAPVFE